MKDDEVGTAAETPFNVLRRFVRRRPVVECCEICSAELSSEHDHLVEPATRRMLCACQPCAILFSGQANTKYRRVPRRILYLTNFQMDDFHWESLMIPIGMAFFFQSSSAEKVVALYPSPAGPMESLLDLEFWEEIIKGNPILLEMEPDTEALLVNRLSGAREYYLLPIDECYKLVGLIRAHWRGLSGGTEVWGEIGSYFGELKRKSVSTGVAANA